MTEVYLEFSNKSECQDYAIVCNSETGAIHLANGLTEDKKGYLTHNKEPLLKVEGPFGVTGPYTREKLVFLKLRNEVSPVGMENIAKQCADLNLSSEEIQNVGTALDKGDYLVAMAGGLRRTMDKAAIVRECPASMEICQLMENFKNAAAAAKQETGSEEVEAKTRPTPNKKIKSGETPANQ
jgi:hypothetical protein